MHNNTRPVRITNKIVKKKYEESMLFSIVYLNSSNFLRKTFSFLSCFEKE